MCLIRCWYLYLLSAGFNDDIFLGFQGTVSQPRTTRPSCGAQRDFFPIQLRSAHLMQISMCTILADATKTVAASVRTQIKVTRSQATHICQKLATRQTECENTGFHQGSVRFHFGCFADCNTIVGSQSIKQSIISLLFFNFFKNSASFN